MLQAPMPKSNVTSAVGIDSTVAVLGGNERCDQGFDVMTEKTVSGIPTQEPRMSLRKSHAIAGYRLDRYGNKIMKRKDRLKSKNGSKVGHQLTFEERGAAVVAATEGGVQVIFGQCVVRLWLSYVRQQVAVSHHSGSVTVG